MNLKLINHNPKKGINFKAFSPAWSTCILNQTSRPHLRRLIVLDLMIIIRWHLTGIRGWIQAVVPFPFWLRHDFSLTIQATQLMEIRTCPRVKGPFLINIILGFSEVLVYVLPFLFAPLCTSLVSQLWHPLRDSLPQRTLIVSFFLFIVVVVVVAAA